jgi:glycosyltransferase involved in cell wall biosynthesis
VLVVSLVSRGSPLELTGGHLYHRRMAERARAHDAVIEWVHATMLRDPLRRARGVVLVDSLAAWSVHSWLLRPQHRDRPLAAIIHQPPGGVAHGALRKALQGRLDEALYRRCDLLLVTSHGFARDLVDRWHLPNERICVVEPGSDLPVAPPAAGEDLRQGRRMALLSVGNWSSNKGVLDLLEAVARLPADRATLHLVGREDVDPHYRRRVQARLDAPDLSARVVVHGPLTPAQVSRLFAGVDAFVSASVGETYGMAFAEALAAGLPIVGWHTGNLANLIEHGREGYLVAPGDVAGLTRALDRLSTDTAWRHQLESAARLRSLALPTWDDAADRFFGALSQLAAGRG